MKAYVKDACEAPRKVRLGEAPGAPGASPSPTQTKKPPGTEARGSRRWALAKSWNPARSHRCGCPLRYAQTGGRGSVSSQAKRTRCELCLRPVCDTTSLHMTGIGHPGLHPFQCNKQDMPGQRPSDRPGPHSGPIYGDRRRLPERLHHDAVVLALLSQGRELLRRRVGRLNFKPEADVLEANRDFLRDAQRPSQV
jgi:hypothetical protein